MEHLLTSIRSLRRKSSIPFCSFIGMNLWRNPCGVLKRSDIDRNVAQCRRSDALCWDTPVIISEILPAPE